MSKKLKMIVAIVAIFVLGLVTYFVMGSSKASDGSVVATKSTTLSREEEVTNQEFLQLLRSLRGVDLREADLLKNPNFTSLSDFSVQLTPQTAGRENPFAPLGVEGKGSFTAPSKEDENSQDNPSR